MQSWILTIIRRSCTFAEALTLISPDYFSLTWSNLRNSTNSLCSAHSWTTTSKRLNGIRKEKPLFRENPTTMAITDPVIRQTSITTPKIAPPLPAMVHITALDLWNWMPTDLESSLHKKKSDGWRKDFACDVGRK